MNANYDTKTLINNYNYIHISYAAYYGSYFVEEILWVYELNNNGSLPINYGFISTKYD